MRSSVFNVGILFNHLNPTVDKASLCDLVNIRDRTVLLCPVTDEEMESDTD